MWSRPAFLLWFSVHVEGKHHFHLVLPIPLLLFPMLTDILEDLSVFVPLFWPKSRCKNWHGLVISPALIRQIASVCSGLTRELVLHASPMDLVDVDVTDCKSRVRVRFLLR